MSKLIIHRKKSILSPRQSFSVSLDDRSIGKLKYGDTQEFEIAPGEHTLHVKPNYYTMASRPYPFSVIEGEHVVLRVRANDKQNLLLLCSALAWLALSRILLRKMNLPVSLNTPVFLVPYSAALLLFRKNAVLVDRISMDELMS